MKASSASRRHVASRSNLHVADLKKHVRTASRVMNVRIPTIVGDAVDRLVKELAATKTDVIIALLNAGLDITATKLPGFRRMR